MHYGIRYETIIQTIIQTWTAKIFWTGAKPEPEPLLETIRHPAYSTIINQNFLACTIL